VKQRIRRKAGQAWSEQELKYLMAHLKTEKASLTTVNITQVKQKILENLREIVSKIASICSPLN